MAELKLQLISGGKSTPQKSSIVKKAQTNLSLSKLTSPFDITYKGKLAKKVYTLSDYNRFTAELMKLSLSYTTKIVRHKKKPTEYYVILLENYEA